MTHIELTRLTLFLNTGCFIAGFIAFSTTAPYDATVNAIIYSALCLLGSLAGIHFIVRKRLPVFSSNDQSDPASPLFKIIIFFPIVLVLFEVIALFYMGAKPDDVVWIPIVMAGYVGQNLEALIPDK